MAEKVLNGFAGALEWNCKLVDTKMREDSLCGELHRAADAVVAIGVLAWIALKLLNKLFAIVCWKIRTNAHYVGAVADRYDRHVGLLGVRHLHRVWQRRDRSVPDKTQRIPVGICACNRAS